jgi:hypothetical protein
MQVTAQKEKPVKDTATFLVSAFRKAACQLVVSIDGRQVYSNTYTISSFAVSGCRLEAKLKMKNVPAGEVPMNYTLTYAIPLEHIYSIKPVISETTGGMLHEYKGAAFRFRVDVDHFYAIKYKMTEDQTKRVETEAGYNEAILHCDPKKAKQVLEVLLALQNRCRPVMPANFP